MTQLLNHFKLEDLRAIRFRTGGYGIRPAGVLGTCGWLDGKPWQIVYSRNLPTGVKLEDGE